MHTYRFHSCPSQYLIVTALLKRMSGAGINVRCGGKWAGLNCEDFVAGQKCGVNSSDNITQLAWCIVFCPSDGVNGRTACVGLALRAIALSNWGINVGDLIVGLNECLKYDWWCDKRLWIDLSKTTIRHTHVYCCVLSLLYAVMNLVLVKDVQSNHELHFLKCRLDLVLVVVVNPLIHVVICLCRWSFKQISTHFFHLCRYFCAHWWIICHNWQFSVNCNWCWLCNACLLSTTHRRPHGSRVVALVCIAFVDCGDDFLHDLVPYLCIGTFPRLWSRDEAI